MKSLLYQELRDLARKILEAPEGEISSLQSDARVLYEKLTVLRYTEGLVEELRHTMGQQEEGTGPEALSPQEPQEEDPREVLQAPVAADAETISDPGPEPELPQPSGTPFEDGTVTTMERTTTVVRSDGSVEMEKTVRVSGKSRDKEYDDLQQSLFGEDLFSKELDFDPDEDIFEELHPSEQGKPAAAGIGDGPVSGNESVLSGPEGPLPQDPSQDPDQDRQSYREPIHTTEEVPVDPAPENSGREKEGAEDGPAESASFFSFRMVKEEESVEDNSPETIPGGKMNDSPESIEEENNEETEIEEKTGIDSQGEETAAEPFARESAQEDEPGGPPAERREISPDPDSGLPEETPAAAEGERGNVSPQPEVSQQQGERPSEEEPHRTINQAAAEKEDARRPSLNEILAASNIRMDMNDRIAFINNLFDGDAESFETSVRYIFSLTDIDVANEYIIEILKPSYNNWFEKEKYERRFAEIVLRHFMDKKK